MKHPIKWIACLALAAPVLCNAANCNETLSAATPIEPVGAYSNPASDLTKNRTPYIYFVQLWRAGNCYFGGFAVNNSRDGEATRGFIDGFTYDPASHATQFSSKLVIGSGSKDFFEFSGKFDLKKFTGTFTYVDKQDKEPPIATKVTLTLEKKYRTTMALDGGKNTYGAWREENKRGRTTW